MLLCEFNYELSTELIADKPLTNRSDSRLLVLDRKDRKIYHQKFSDIINYFEKDDCLVLNNTKVIPARLIGNIDGSEKEVEILLTREIDKKNSLWEIITKKSKKIKAGLKLSFCNKELTGEIVEKLSDGKSIINFTFRNGSFDEILEKFGNMPLPPYILKKRKNGTVPKERGQSLFFLDKERYQTVFAKVKGSIAAPTAGLHFTDDLINLIKEKGVKIVEVTLHIGIGTFRPIRTENIEEHNMDKEYFEISEKVIKVISNTKKAGKKIFAVGSTVTRALESVMGDCPNFFERKNGTVPIFNGWTDIFIYPGFKFKVVDSLITNLHLSGSTPLLLVCAFADKGLIFYAYNEAIKNSYRFLSYGDSMLII